jgi:NAD(P)-dependent dehydrogenase (short-subunit alcohol dehydrogenase family)
MTRIDGKVVAITGAGSGIGESTATLLASRGAKLVFAAPNSDVSQAFSPGSPMPTVGEMLMGKENRPGLVALTCIFSVELPGIEPATEIPLTCRNAELDYAKVREATCGYAKGVDGVNNTRPVIA